MFLQLLLKDLMVLLKIEKEKETKTDILFLNYKQKQTEETLLGSVLMLSPAVSWDPARCSWN